ncbi:hypothetical protein FQN54_006343 [Arachnomyces sp. PD_36]|nr:hypothetical protein FQN54_006343 [Arachnomyces sp. PD_36]
MSKLGPSHPPAHQQQQAEEPQQWYRVLQPEFDTVAHDPLDPPKRYHTGIFIETNQTRAEGKLFHVTGDVIAANGMWYEERQYHAARDLTETHRYDDTQIGWVLRADYDSGRIGSVLRALPRPTKQQGINFWEIDPVTGRHEIIWTKENGERYAPGEERRPVFKCNEWTNRLAAPALRETGILRDAV